MKKMTIAVLLMVISGFIFAQSEDDFEVRQLANGTVEITRYNGSERNITIPRKLFDIPVSGIGRSAFSYSHESLPIDTLTIESGIKTIERRAFYDKSLKYVYFPDTIEEIGDHAFANCDLQELKLPKSLKTLSANAFSESLENCTSVSISVSSLTIFDIAFGSSSIKELFLEGVFPKDRRSIGKELFYFPNLEKIVIQANWPDRDLDIGFSQGFANFYKLQGRKGGVYIKNGPLWTFAGTQ